MPAKAQHSGVSTRIVGALLWRARREGVKSVLLLPAAIALLPVLAMIWALADPSSLHGALSSPAITGGGALGYMVALMAMMSGLVGVGMGAAMCVRSAVGSEASNGSFELMLGTGFTPRQIWSAFVRVLLLAVVTVWVIVGVVLTICVTAVVRFDHIGLRATALFWSLLVLGPLVLAMAGAVLALGVGLSRPAFFEPTRNGLVHANGGIADLLAMAPALVCLLVFAIAFPTLGAAGMGAVCVAVVLLAAGTGCWFGVKRFSREQVISSL